MKYVSGTDCMTHPQYVGYGSYSRMKEAYAGLTTFPSHLFQTIIISDSYVAKQNPFEMLPAIPPALPCCALQAAFPFLLIEHLVRTFSV